MEYTAEQIKDLVVEACLDTKAKDIAIIKVDHLTVIADYLVIASGKSTTQVKAIANNIDEHLSKVGIEPLRREGIAEGRWAVVDYGIVLAHVFNEESRKLYLLDQLWSDGSNVTFIEESRN